MATPAYRIAFLQTVKEQLFANAEFIMASESHDAFVNNKTVKIPQSGTTPDITIDRAVWPMAAESRDDDTRSYDLKKYDTGLIRIEDIEEMWLSYDKRASVLKSYTDKLNKSVGDRAAYQWGQDFVTDGTTPIRTTGTARSGISPAGTTGTRYAMTLTDWFNAIAKIAADNFDIATGKMNACVPALMWYNFLAENKELLNSQYMNTANLVTGSVAKVAGVNVFVRGNTVTYTKAATPLKKAVGAAVVATDEYGCLLWHSDAVCRAKSPVKLFLDTDRAEYQGSIMSADILFEAELSRSDYKGIATIVQAEA